jgi:uncharacterized protein YrrD
MNLEIGADVLGPDGKLGTLTQIVIEPLGERVTHVIVERGGLHPWVKVVPTETLTHTENARVWTRLTLPEMEALPDYLSLSESGTAPAMPSDVPLADLHPVGLLWPSNVLGWYLPSHQSSTPAPPQANLPPGTHGLKAGTEVHGRDGKVGHLDEVVYDQESGRATGMIIRKGFFFARELEAPIDWVEAINDTIRLSVRRDEIPERRRRRR